MLSTSFHNLIRLTLITLNLSFNVCHASDFIFGDAGNSDTASTPVIPAGITRIRFVENSEPTSPANSTGRSYTQNTSLEDATTIAGDAGSLAENDVTNGSLAKPDAPTQPDDKTMGFVTVANTQPEFMISDATFKTLIIPEPISPFTHITILKCTCFKPIHSASFQSNPELIHLVLAGSYLNFEGNEGKLFEGCPTLKQIDLRGTADRSIDKDNPITPERFAQLVHPDILLRILDKKCTVLILNPEEETCYTLDKMKPKFLQGVAELRCVQESQKSIYQRIVAILSKGINEFDSANVAGFGVRAAIKACTGL